jgi:hypothetical protein
MKFQFQGSPDELRELLAIEERVQSILVQTRVIQQPEIGRSSNWQQQLINPDDLLISIPKRQSKKQGIYVWKLLKYFRNSFIALTFLTAVFFLVAVSQKLQAPQTSLKAPQTDTLPVPAPPDLPSIREKLDNLPVIP